MLVNILIFLMVIAGMAVVFIALAIHKNVRSGFRSSAIPHKNNKGKIEWGEEYGEIRRRTKAGSEVDAETRISLRESEIRAYHAPKKRLVKRAEGKGRRANSARRRLAAQGAVVEQEVRILRRMLTPVNQKDINEAEKAGKKPPKPRYHPGAGRIGPKGETLHGIGRAGHGTRGHGLNIVHKAEDMPKSLFQKIIIGSKRKKK